MSSPEYPNGIDQYYRKIITLQSKAIESQIQKLEEAAAQMAITVHQDGRIFVFGTGHSHMMAEEAFYRAGGLVPAVPIISSALMLHENPTLSSYLERTAGIADVLLDKYQVERGEMIFIYSNSGVNQLPVEMALRAKERELFVVSISSLAYSKKAPLSVLGKRLDEAADIAIDNCGEPGDALVQIGGTDWRIGASSTVVNTVIWNCLLVECIQRLHAMGAELPVFASLNMPGAKEHNDILMEKWGERNPHL